MPDRRRDNLGSTVVAPQQWCSRFVVSNGKKSRLFV
jgi:hypothetical protein